MPKRRNPFGESSPLQLKQHVSMKQIDLGVCHEENMKRVYEKTRELLFSGSKKSLSTPNRDSNENVVSKLSANLEVPMEHEDVTNRQLQIGHCGQLVIHSIIKTRPKRTNVALFNGKAISSCQCCKGQAASQDRCGFCEKSVCHGCIRQCESCNGQFCQLCSVMNYEDIAERSFCLNCAS